MVRSLGVECQNRIKFSEKMQHTFPTTIPRCTRSILVAVANIRRLVYWIKVFAVLRKVVVRWMAGIRCSQVHVTSLLNQVLALASQSFFFRSSLVFFAVVIAPPHLTHCLRSSYGTRKDKRPSKQSGELATCRQGRSQHEEGQAGDRTQKASANETSSHAPSSSFQYGRLSHLTEANSYCCLPFSSSFGSN